MGESMVESPNIESKMGESVASHSTLEVSISFGRFENDSLSWEKWSTFSQNKYLEEVEKCSTPGSVAQKKAYFEAHYKKIAARKAEIIEQENSMGTDPSILDDMNCKDQTENISGSDAELCISNGHRSTEEVEQGTNSSTLVDEPREDSAISLGCNISSVEECKEELNGNLESHDFKKPEEASLVKEESLLKGPQDMVEQPAKVEFEKRNTPESKVESLKLGARNISQKITPTKKEQNSVGTTKKKPESPIPKSLPTSTPRLSKPKSTSTVMSSSRSSTKKMDFSSLPRSKNSSSVGESKRVAPTSLHMSLSLGSGNSDSTSNTSTRRSLIMEKMGDKDIVKRAFKTFQNNLNQLSYYSDEKSCGPKKVATKGTEQKVSAPMTSRKVNERSIKEAGVDGRNIKAASSSIGLRSDERSEKQKQFFKKFEEKSDARETEKTRLSTKSKGEKEAEIKKLRQRLNFKAKPMPDIYRGQGISKSLSEKEGVKIEIGRVREWHR